MFFFHERKENHEIKIGSNSQFLPIESRFISRYFTCIPRRYASASPAFSSSLVSEEGQIKSVNKQQSKWLDIIWHCRLAIRIILSLAFIGTVSHINVLSDMQIELFLCGMQRGRCTPCIEDMRALKRTCLRVFSRRVTILRRDISSCKSLARPLIEQPLMWPIIR